MALESLIGAVNISEESEEQSREEQSREEQAASSSTTTSLDLDNHTGQISGNSPPTASSSVNYSNSTVPYSTRIQSMIESRSSFSSETEFDIVCSRDHWSELTGSDTDTAATRLANREHFEVLKQHSEWGGFFRDVKVELGEKINEGGQAEIFDAKVEFEDGRKSPGFGYYVVKVMKGDSPLQDFQRQWPVGMLCNASKERVKGPLMWIQGGTLVDDRFAFVMVRQWGDLRKLIDMKMQLNYNRGPPFAKNIAFVKKVMLCIAKDMEALHKKYEIVHRDLKASNVLLWSFGEGLPDGNPHVKANVVDYECSLGVLGTGFWRAPEVLEQLKKRIPSSEVTFSFMTDVYSYGMTCYELLTGRIPFEDHCTRDYDLVLSGNRPNFSLFAKLEHPLVVRLLEWCWDPEPWKRPTFSEIVQMLEVENAGITDDNKKFKFAVSRLQEQKADIVDKLKKLRSGAIRFNALEFIADELLRVFPKSDVPEVRVMDKLMRRPDFYTTFEMFYLRRFFDIWFEKLGIDGARGPDEVALTSLLERRLARIEREFMLLACLCKDEDDFKNVYSYIDY